MTPKIISNPLLKLFQAAADNRAKLASSLSHQIDHSVCSLYAYMGKKYPEQMGSGVLLKIAEKIFILTAAHVMEEYKEHPVIIGLDDKLHFLRGERYSSAKGKSGSHQDDPIDVAVFHILQADVTESIANKCIQLADLDLVRTDQKDLQVLIGFRAKKSKISNRIAKSIKDSYTLMECLAHDYNKLGLSRDHYVALSWEDELYSSDNLISSPSLKGMSGGGIFRVVGLDQDPFSSYGDTLHCKLSGITIESIKKTHLRPGAVLGVRVINHLFLIHKFLPELADQIDMFFEE